MRAAAGQEEARRTPAVAGTALRGVIGAVISRPRHALARQPRQKLGDQAYPLYEHIVSLSALVEKRKQWDSQRITEEIKVKVTKITYRRIHRDGRHQWEPRPRIL